MQWNATLYDRQHDFVSKYGEDLIAVLQPRAGEKILDLGCGTGDLARELSLKGCDVTGTDASGEMIAEAKDKYPGIRFLCADARDLDLGEQFDAVFSNAVLHWIKDQDAVLENVFRHLKKGGRFVAELGARGNVEKIITAIRNTLEKQGHAALAATDTWYFPSAAAYAAKLEQHGFDIRFMASFDRPTLLQDTGEGVVRWLEMFGNAFFRGIGEAEKQKLLHEIQETLRDDLYRDGRWHADYKRLRFHAVKA